MMLMPLVSWGRIVDDLADEMLVAWGHWLGGCNRPFGRQSFGLWLDCELVSVAVSASTVVDRCACYERGEVVELARQASHPDHRDLTRVCLRLWRVTAPAQWARFWPVRACVSYSNSLRHSGEIYRLDGWLKWADVRGGVKNGTWGRGRQTDPKAVWVWPVDPVEREQLRVQLRERDDPRASRQGVRAGC